MYIIVYKICVEWKTSNGNMFGAFIVPFAYTCIPVLLNFYISTAFFCRILTIKNDKRFNVNKHMCDQIFVSTSIFIPIHPFNLKFLSTMPWNIVLHQLKMILFVLYCTRCLLNPVFLKMGVTQSSNYVNFYLNNFILYTNYEFNW